MRLAINAFFNLLPFYSDNSPKRCIYIFQLHQCVTIPIALLKREHQWHKFNQNSWSLVSTWLINVLVCISKSAYWNLVKIHSKALNSNVTNFISINVSGLWYIMPQMLFVHFFSFFLLCVILPWLPLVSSTYAYRSENVWFFSMNLCFATVYAKRLQLSTFSLFYALMF